MQNRESPDFRSLEIGRYAKGLKNCFFGDRAPPFFKGLDVPPPPHPPLRSQGLNVALVLEVTLKLQQ